MAFDFLLYLQRSTLRKDHIKAQYNDKVKFGLHFKYIKCKISKRIIWLNNQIDIQTNLRIKTTVVCIRHRTFVMSLFRTSLLLLILCVCLRRFTFLIDSPTQNEIIGSHFQVMDGATFLTSTFIYFSGQDQFHLFLIPIPRLTESSSRVTILDILMEQLVNFISYHYYVETKDKSNNINDIVIVPVHW